MYKIVFFILLLDVCVGCHENEPPVRLLMKILSLYCFVVTGIFLDYYL